MPDDRACPDVDDPAAPEGLRARLHRLAGDDAVRRLLRGGFWALAIKSASAVLSLVMLAAMARAMSVEEYGRFAVGFSLAMVAAVFSGLGLHIGILRWRPEHEVQGAPDLARGAERWGFNMTLASSVCFAALLAGVALALDAGLGAASPLSGPGAPISAAALTGAAALAATLAVSSYVQFALRARGPTIAALAPREVAWRGAVALAGAAIAAAGASVGAAQGLWIAAALLAAITLGQAAAMRISPGPQPGGADRVPALGLSGPARFWMAQARPIWASDILAVMRRHFEVVIVGMFLAPAVTGLYFAALATANVVALLLIAGNLVAGPMIARAHHSGDRAGLQRLLRLLNAAIAGPTLCSLAVLWIWGAEILAVFDPAFADGAALLAVLTLGTAVNALAGPTALSLSLAGQERAIMRVMAVCVLGVTALQFAAAPLLGVFGVAWLNVAGMVAMNVWSRQICVRKLGVDPSVLCLLPRRRVAAP